MNINNITNTSGNWTLISNNIPNINTTVNITATPKKTRNWTGKPRGRTPEQINIVMHVEDNGRVIDIILMVGMLNKVLIYFLKILKIIIKEKN